MTLDRKQGTYFFHNVESDSLTQELKKLKKQATLVRPKIINLL